MEVHAAQVLVFGTGRDAEQEQAGTARRRQPAAAVGWRRCRHPLGLPVAHYGCKHGSEGIARPLERGPVVQGLLAVPHRQEEVHQGLLDVGRRQGAKVLPRAMDVGSRRSAPGRRDSAELADLVDDEGRYSCRCHSPRGRGLLGPPWCLASRRGEEPRARRKGGTQCGRSRGLHHGRWECGERQRC